MMSNIVQFKQSTVEDELIFSIKRALHEWLNTDTITPSTYKKLNRSLQEFIFKSETKILLVYYTKTEVSVAPEKYYITWLKCVFKHSFSCIGQSPFKELLQTEKINSIHVEVNSPEGLSVLLSFDDILLRITYPTTLFGEDVSSDLGRWATNKQQKRILVAASSPRFSKLAFVQDVFNVFSEKGIYSDTYYYMMNGSLLPEVVPYETLVCSSFSTPIYVNEKLLHPVNLDIITKAKDIFYCPATNQTLRE